jgi:hypothetical protein
MKPLGLGTAIGDVYTPISPLGTSMAWYTSPFGTWGPLNTCTKSCTMAAASRNTYFQGSTWARRRPSGARRAFSGTAG